MRTRVFQVERYPAEVEAHLMHILGEKSSLSITEKARFLREATQSVGRTALCLSGGGMLALHHSGVVKVLLEQGLLPRIISGSSGGSIITAIIGVTRDDELASLLTDEFARHLDDANMQFCDKPLTMLR